MQQTGELVRHGPTAVIVVRPVELRGAEQALSTAVEATMPPVLTQAQPMT
jgi:hypothetical protein